jgi:hypothetical protein
MRPSLLLSTLVGLALIGTVHAGKLQEEILRQASVMHLVKRPSLVYLTLQVRKEVLFNTSWSPFRPGANWHTCQTTVFWCGEPATAHSPSNFESSYDPLWFLHYRYENSFYVAVPYCDIDDHGHTKPTAVMAPWYRSEFKADGISIMKDRWVELRAGNRIAFAQIKDSGPYSSDDPEYVFGNAPPLPHANNQAALDVSPAVRDYLGLSGLSTCSWRFCSAQKVIPGPWTTYALSLYESEGLNGPGVAVPFWNH